MRISSGSADNTGPWQPAQNAKTESTARGRVRGRSDWKRCCDGRAAFALRARLIGGIAKGRSYWIERVRRSGWNPNSIRSTGEFCCFMTQTALYKYWKACRIRRPSGARIH